MSPHVGNFVADLVEMAKATETLPIIQAELDATKADNESLHKAVQAREEAIARYKAEIDALHAKVRDTEAQRDDAELRFHEGQDRTRSALDFIKSTFGSAGSLIQALEPPAQVEPVVEAQPVPAVVPQGQDVPAWGGPPEYQPKPIDNPLYGDPQTDAPQGQSEPLPPTAMSETTQSQAAPSTTVESEVNASTEGTAAPQPDPTMPNSSPSTDGATQSSSATPDYPSTSGPTSTPAPEDDVGYHNEPNMTGTTDWSEWDKWAARMTARYGVGQWPTRPSTATA